MDRIHSARKAVREAEDCTRTFVVTVEEGLGAGHVVRVVEYVTHWVDATRSTSPTETLRRFADLSKAEAYAEHFFDSKLLEGFSSIASA